MATAQKRYDEELFHVRRSVKYHDHRRRFFENVLNVSLFLAFVGGPVFVLLSITLQTDHKEASDWIKYTPILFTSVFTGVALVAKVGTKSNLHNELKVEFIRLRQDMERGRETMQDSDVSEWTAQRLAIETREPPINRVVDAICHNEVVQSMGIKKPTAYVRVLWGHRVVGPFVRSFDTGLRLYKKDEKGPAWV